MENQEKKHKRRVRYSGTHPKKFSEKYKEHQPDKYKDTIQHIIKKGSTPAGMHISIMVNEIIEFLAIQPGQQGLDATLGYGGHTLEMLKCLRKETNSDIPEITDENKSNLINNYGRIVGLDVDPIESSKTKERLASKGYGEEILSVKLINFANIDQVANEFGKFDFVLADLGVSSMQIDNPKRGFSFKVDGPLDLRLNPQKGMSAAQRLREMTQEEMEGMFIENADEPYAAEIARGISSRIKGGVVIETTYQLQQIIEKTLKFLPEKGRKDAVKKSCQRCFQALRIDVNREYEVLYEFLDKLPGILNPNGRVAILSFHSGEDRLVKKSFKDNYREGIFKDISTSVIRPTTEECNRNPRARSTKMRWAIKA